MFVYYYTFGCKVNQYETENIRQAMEARGFETVKDVYAADIYIINSCTVTAQADLKLRQMVHKLRRVNENGVIVVCGCYSQVLKSHKAALPEADIFAGTSNKTEIPKLVEEFVLSRQAIVSVNEHFKGEKIELMKNLGSKNKTRAIIKIQDGCDRFCSYCIIPYARGRIRSKPLKDIEAEAKELAKTHDELVLVGINLSCYGQDVGGIDLADAVEVVCRTSGAKRVRLGSLEPELLTEDIIKRLSKCKELCPHFHLSLQSGCDKTLKEMRRKYGKAEYFTLVSSLRENFSDCAITTDIMVGFPGESDENFAQSLEFVKSIGFAQAHIFPYSKRNGTVAAKRTDQIPSRIKDVRSKEMAEATKASEKAFLEAMVGTVQEVLFERERSKDYHQGHTRNYVLVKVKLFTDSMWRKTAQVRITSCGDGYVLGEIV
ncbi:MAG: tRNA (N(6)-L-threonylcarbamoyladenosine(37)-C(2))-methylthiotransferase MtaB [Oscillospiraceae bacterium]|nr:tRNA (N(6)-L-threonylcarbamoyladenosine(37)-C(2))-methylthiotransferase MtaB [Oscillospiraceae bacterium]